MRDGGSVTVWLDRLKAGEQRDEAVAKLWGRYFGRLVGLARDRLRARTRVADGEDVALNAFDSFVRAAQAGRFPRLDDRDDLWQVLLMLTARKAENAARDENRQKKGGGRAILAFAAGEDDSDGVPEAAASDPDPAEAALLAEEVEELLRALDNDELRRVAVWALEGYSNQEIADKLRKSEKTVERKLRLIRIIWSARGATKPSS